MHMGQKQTISLQSKQTRAYNGLTIITKVLGLYYIHGEYYYCYGGRLEKLIGQKLHDICSSFINKVIITIVWVGVGVFDDDVVLRAS